MLGRTVIARTRNSVRGASFLSAASAASSSSLPASTIHYGIRTLADIAVEHARGDWKTYGNLESYKPGNFHILTFNKISPIGLARFPSDKYCVVAGDSTQDLSKSNAHAILLRSHKLQEDQVPHTVRAIAR